MRRCFFCLNDLVTVHTRPGVVECARCGLRYSTELLHEVDEARWDEILSSPRYRIERSPIGDAPPTVSILDLIAS